LARRFVNLNRFKNGRAIKRNIKQKAGLPDKNRIKRDRVKFRGKNK
jgi:hypothetical protein